MSGFVLDCSVTVSWAFEDENAPYAEAVLDSLTAQKAIVPGLWRLETVNALLAAERRRRIAPAQVDTFLRFLRTLPIRIDAGAESDPPLALAELARRHDLTAYDAEYLGLAIRENLPLATMDRQLAEAASRAGVASLAPR